MSDEITVDFLEEEAGKGPVEKTAETALDVIADSLGNAVGEILSTFATAWMNTPEVPIDETSGPLGFLLGSTVGLATVAFAAGIMVLAIKMMMAGFTGQRVDGEVAKYILGMMFAYVCAIGILQELMPELREFSRDIIDWGTEGEEFTSAMARLVVPVYGIGPVWFSLLCFFLIIASGLQTLVMLARGFVLLFILGILPLLAALAFTKTGEAWFKSAIGAGVAWLVLEPVAAMIYGFGFRIFGMSYFASDGILSGLATSIMGTVWMVVAAFVILMLLKKLSPAVTRSISIGGSVSNAVSRGGAMFAGSALGLTAHGAVSNGSSAPAVPMSPAVATRTDSNPGGAVTSHTSQSMTAGAGPAGATGTAGMSAGAGPAGVAADVAVKAAKGTASAAVGSSESEKQ